MVRVLAFVGALIFSPAFAWAQQPCTSDARRVVDEIYRHMLERGADPGSSGMVERLTSGNATVRDVVREVAKSPEHRQRFYNPQEGNVANERAVGALYRHILGRQADPAGQRTYAEMAARRGLDAVVDSLLESSEYNQSFGDWGVPGSGGMRYCGNDRPQANSRTNDDMRFRDMDRDNDGRISRDEWHGSRQSWAVHDWNNDGVLSGDELRTGASRRGRSVDDENFDRAERFEYLDADNDGWIESDEWHGSRAAFSALDRNDDNQLSRAEFTRAGGSVPTTGEIVTVSGTDRWTDTGIVVRAGDNIVLDVDGTVQLSNDANDVASAAGSRSGRQANDAPLRDRPAGSLIARIGNGAPFFVGGRRTFRAQGSGRLYLGVNDDHLGDNSGEFRVAVAVER